MVVVLSHVSALVAPFSPAPGRRLTVSYPLA
jgi:hypothetical protein